MHFSRLPSAFKAMLGHLQKLKPKLNHHHHHTDRVHKQKNLFKLRELFFNPPSCVIIHQ